MSESVNTRRSAKDIFFEAIERPSEERDEFIRLACRDDGGLLADVLGLVRSHSRAGRFMDAPSSSRSGAAAWSIPTESPGQVIGRYTLVELLGEGGFGVVFRAEQQEPVRREVALKILKVGMDTRAIVARFEAERQALALMDHPGIARIYDAGATETGRPYFAMELVHGEPIVGYCRDHGLSLTDRLDLFRQVCRAVQHAHTKGMIHRDIKPGNVLVQTVDGKPAPKIIDFGIAKAAAGHLDGQTVFTELRQFIGTPEYMSPEQAGAVGATDQDIDARTDIYSLGVLLYELLTGVTPFDPRKLRSAAWGELQRIIREEEPQRPSTRLSRISAGTGAATGLHGEAYRAAAARLRGDLDWIVMRCLEKDRDRRYQTADALAEDISRHMAGRPVEAAPPSAAYRARKFVRRHRGPVISAGIVALALLAGMASTAVALVKTRAASAEAHVHAMAEQQNAERARDEASNARRQAAVAEATVRLLTEDLLGGADTAREKGRSDVTVRELLDRAAKRLDSGESLRSVSPEARETVQNAVRCAVARTYRAIGLYSQAADQARLAVEAARAATPVNPGQLGEALLELGEIRRARQERDNARAALEEALELMVQAHGENSAQVGDVCNALAGVDLVFGEYAPAEELERRALEIQRSIGGDRSVKTAMLMGNLAQILSKRRKGPEAAAMLEQAAQIHRELLGENDLQYTRDLFNIGVVKLESGDAPGAETNFRSCMERLRALYPEDHPDIARCKRNLGWVLLIQGKLDDAEQMVRAALAIDRRTAGQSRAMTLMGLSALSRTLMAARRYDEAEETLGEWEDVLIDVYAGTSGKQSRIAECRSLRGEAIVRGLRAALDGGGGAPADAAARLREAESMLVEAFEVLEQTDDCRLRFMTDAESKRCEGARRLVLLYETWQILDGRSGSPGPDRDRLATELTRWQREYERVKKDDADAPTVSN